MSIGGTIIHEINSKTESHRHKAAQDMLALKTEQHTERLTITIPEAAKALGISRGLAYELAKQGQLPVPVIRIGEKRIVVSRSQIEKLLDGNGEPNGTPTSEVSK